MFSKLKDETLLPVDYINTLATMKQRVTTARYHSMQKINKELILLYWDMGKIVYEKVESGGWGKNIVEQLSADLQAEFAGVRGLSSRNIWYMKQFYETYRVDEKMQRLVAEIPWGQNIEIFTKAKTTEERLFYMGMCKERAWSRPTLSQNIKTKSYKHSLASQNNFLKTVPKTRLEELKWEFKDEYDFSFLNLEDEFKEKELENGLVCHITKTLGQFGTDFAFMGQQFRLELDEREYFIDLLFYHRKLKSMIAIELKATEFKPEHSQQLNWYLHLLDKTVKYPEDNASIGILLCKTKNKLTVEYALELVNKPMGIATYQYSQLPQEIAVFLPSEDDFNLILDNKALSC